MKETYEKVYIRSKADLPKEDEKYYFGYYKDSSTAFSVIYYEYDIRDVWLKTVSWYLQPITPLSRESDAGQREENEDEIDLSSPDYRHDCVKCGNSFWNKTKNDVICESCKSSITINDMTRKEPDVQLSCSQQDKYDLSRTIAIQSRIIAKQEELIKSYSGLIKHFPQGEMCSVCDDFITVITRIEQELKELKGIDHK